MIDIAIQNELLILLRSLLLLGPLFITFYFAQKHLENERFLVGGLFSFLYSLALLLPAHALAIHFGMWRYGGNALMLLGMPADLWFAGSILFGPAIFFAFPRLSPLIFTIGFVVLQAFVFKSLDPFVIAGDWWFAGVVAIFLIAHIPALYLARWTAYDEYLPKRAALLAFGFGFLAFFTLPTLIMHAMGGDWNFHDKSLSSYILTTLFLAPYFILGLGAVHMFVVHGEGTPIPLDKTKHLVTSGIYAYVCNPMQLCSALSWFIIGVFLGSFYVSAASIMAVVFVLGIVRWHQRNDLQKRFPEGWLEYRNNVSEWLPRWKPWIKHNAEIAYNPQSTIQHKFVTWLQRRHIVGLDVKEGKDKTVYIDQNRRLQFYGAEALVYTLFHINFMTAIIGAGLLLLLIPIKMILPANKEKINA